MSPARWHEATDHSPGFNLPLEEGFRAEGFERARKRGLRAFGPEADQQDRWSPLFGYQDLPEKHNLSALIHYDQGVYSVYLRAGEQWLHLRDEQITPVSEQAVANAASGEHAGFAIAVYSPYQPQSTAGNDPLTSQSRQPSKPSNPQRIRNDLSNVAVVAELFANASSAAQTRIERVEAARNDAHDLEPGEVNSFSGLPLLWEEHDQGSEYPDNLGSLSATTRLVRDGDEPLLPYLVQRQPIHSFSSLSDSSSAQDPPNQHPGRSDKDPQFQGGWRS